MRIRLVQPRLVRHWATLLTRLSVLLRAPYASGRTDCVGCEHLKVTLHVWIRHGENMTNCPYLTTWDDKYLNIQSIGLHYPGLHRHESHNRTDLFIRLNKKVWLGLEFQSGWQGRCSLLTIRLNTLRHTTLHTGFPAYTWLQVNPQMLSYSLVAYHAVRDNPEETGPV